ncbi:hypothetical protein ACVRZD_04915 [Streptococcus hongkongensis]|nr:lipoprotein [Streptococcus uberis]
MKQAKTERLFLVLSIITVIIAGGIYFIFGDMGDVKSNDNTTQSVQSVVTKNNPLTEAIDLVAEAEKNPSQEAIDQAQKMLDQAKDTSTKKRLQKKLDQVKSNLESYNEAKKAVEDTKNTPTTDNKALAQAAIDKVVLEDKKAELQSQLDAIVIIDQPVTNSTTTIPASGTVDYGQAPAENYYPQAPATIEPTQPVVPNTGASSNAANTGSNAVINP